MARIAILGGGLAGLSAAYELEQHRLAGKNLDWHLFEASAKLGGLLSTTRIQTAEGDYILEDGPDGWLTEKPQARQLAEELGLHADLLPCNEADRRTYLAIDHHLTPMPARMRLMVPEDLSALAGSPLFTPEAKAAYAAELRRAAELRAAAPQNDESIASFTLRHFGPEVLAKVAAPLLAGVFGGDVESLSVRAVMPQFVAMEREHGSLIAALQHRGRIHSTHHRTAAPTSPIGAALGLTAAAPSAKPTFTSLRNGTGSLTQAIVAALPADRLHRSTRAVTLRRTAHEWLVRFTGPDAHACAIGFVPYDQVFLATPTDVTRTLLTPIEAEAASLLPAEASSALLVTLCWPASQAKTIEVPPGFGFLVPPTPPDPRVSDTPRLLAATFADQKYAHRAPSGARIIRAFFGDRGAQALAHADDASIAAAALAELRLVLGPLPPPDPGLTTIRRWPRSLPQYAVGHLDRMAQLKRHMQQLGQIQLLGNSYHGVGIPDLIRDARAAARTLAESLP